MITKRMMSLALFKKGKMIPSARNTMLKLGKVNPIKSKKLVGECKKLTTVLNIKLAAPKSKIRTLELERLAKRISDWEKRADAYVHSEEQLLGNMAKNTPSYERIHLFRNELTIIQATLEIAEQNGLLEKGYTKKALNIS